jgi:hypothetical protein
MSDPRRSSKIGSDRTLPHDICLAAITAARSPALVSLIAVGTCIGG